MATNLSATINLTGGGSYSNALDLTTPVDRVTIGGGTSGSSAMSAIQFAVINGTGSSQADLWFHDERSVTTGNNDNLDLAGVLINPITGAVLTFVEIRLILIRIISPDGTKSLRIGPQGVANAWQGPWGGTGATVYDTVHDIFLRWNRYDGGLVTAVTAGSADLLVISNQSGVTVVYDVWIIGTSA